MNAHFSPLALRAGRSVSVLLLSLSIGACEPAGEGNSAKLAVSATADRIASAAQTEPLPLRIPIPAVMTGAINRSSSIVFQAAASTSDLSEDDWLSVGEAAVNLTGAATLITIPGTGPQDAEWTTNPKWRGLSSDMQDAAIAVGAAASKKDRSALTESTARLAQSCQSCHLEFSARLLTAPPLPETSAPHP
jgi:hypothetical protein